MRIFIAILVLITSSSQYAEIIEPPITLGPRPFYLIGKMANSPLKEALMECAAKTQSSNDFVIGHRGAPLQFPEHTKEQELASPLVIMHKNLFHLYGAGQASKTDSH